MNTIDERSMTLAFHWTGQNPAGWLASEKLWDCRVYWDGHRIWTRSGNIVDAPEWFTTSLPVGVHLDGGIYAGRDGFEQARKATQYGCQWFTPAIRFAVYDAPQAPGTWAQRMRFAADYRNAIVQPVEFQTIRGEAHLLAMFRAIKRNGGEGVMLRHPDAVGYPTGRTLTALKVKHEAQFNITARQEAA